MAPLSTMPTLPSFDVYQELELLSTATAGEITASYRRLALLHHPDKNGNSPAATEKFQRLQSAFETLKDSDSRRRYDARSASSSSSSASYSYESPSSHDRDSFGSADEFDDEFFTEFEFVFGGRRGPFPFSFRPGDFFGRRTAPTEAEMKEAAKKSRESEETFRKQRQKEYQERWDREHAKREAAEAAKRKQQEDEQAKKDEKVREERNVQEKVWKTVGATTEEQRQKSCLHSDFWPKEQQKKKFKCTSCLLKRGMTGFRCPHCALLACQVCLTSFNKKRAKVTKAGKS